MVSFAVLALRIGATLYFEALQVEAFSIGQRVYG
jgi:hypothetical protein